MHCLYGIEHFFSQKISTKYISNRDIYIYVLLIAGLYEGLLRVACTAVIQNVAINCQTLLFHPIWGHAY